MTGHTRVYVDMVGDLFHPGRVELLRQARSFGDWLVVGVLSDDVVADYKRRPLMTLDERVGVIRACRYVDEVVPDAPDVVTTDFLLVHDISLVVHGDDISDEAVETVYVAGEAGVRGAGSRSAGGAGHADQRWRARTWEALEVADERATLCSSGRSTTRSERR